MKRFLVASIIGILLTLVFLVLAGMGAGACHCSTPMMILFPFVSMLGEHADWGIVGFLLFGLQFPMYAVIIASSSGKPTWIARALLILFAFHVWAVWLAFRIT